MTYHGEKIELESASAAPLILLTSTAVAIGGLVYAVMQIKAELSGTPGVLALILGSIVSYKFWGVIKRGADHMRIHVPTGVVEHVTNGEKVIVPLPQFSAMTITSYRRARGPNHPDWHKLEVAGPTPLVVCDDTNRSKVERLRNMLDDARIQDAIRRLLAGVPLDASAATDPVAYVRQLVPAPIPRDAALRALEQDPDAQIAARAAELRRAMAG